MKRNSLPAALVVALAACTFAASAATFDEIQFWVGSGPNRAALVIDWNDGKSAESILWGYRWDGAATGQDMLEAVVNADPRLFAHFGNYEWGTAVLGIGYDLNNSGGFAVSPSLAFDGMGVALDTNPDDARAPADTADHWLEGWNNGFWAYYLRASTAENWASAMTGAGGRALADGVWDGFSFAAGFASSDPSAPMPASVPEPSLISLLTLGAFAIVCLRRRNP